MSTRAIQYLKQKTIEFEVISYKHKKKGAEYAAKAAGVALEFIVKTLVADLGDKRFCLALLPGNRQLSFKRLARACSVKKSSLADNFTAERLTGYLVGGISPFGTRQVLPVIMDENILQFEKVLINGGQRGTLIKISPDDIKMALDCDTQNIST